MIFTRIAIVVVLAIASFISIITKEQETKFQALFVAITAAFLLFVTFVFSDY